MSLGAMPAPKRSDVIVYRHLTPVPRPEDLTPENERALAEFRSATNVGEDVDLTGEWWGVIAFDPRRFQRCDSQQDAECAGLALGREIGTDVGLQENGHPSARLLVTSCEKELNECCSCKK